MADENVVDPLHFDLAPAQLQLSSFGAINQEEPLIMVYQVRCWIALKRRYRWITAKYGYIKYHFHLFELVK